MKTALITGVTGQDGSYLVDLLLKKGYDVYGLIRRSASPNMWRISHTLEKITLLDGDMTDMGSLTLALSESKPDEIYNMAGQSFVPTSFRNKAYTMQVNAIGVANLLDAMKATCPHARLVQASSSEIFGKVTETPQREDTRPHPRSPYGISKLAGYWFVRNARDADKLFACNSICFNHESPRRGEEFVTRKVTLAAARISAGKQDKLMLGNLEARRDWGYAPEYVEAMWEMLQHDEPGDYVIATGVQHSIEDLCRVAFTAAGLDSWEDYVVTDKRYIRPSEVDLLCGDAEKARTILGWSSTTSFSKLISIMVEADMDRVDSGEL